MKRIITSIAAAAALTGTSARAATETCITAGEMNGLVTYFLPQVIDKVVDTCGAHLPDSSYLRTSFGARADELRTEADAAWPQARAAFIKIGGGKNAKDAATMADLPDEALRPLVEVGLAQALGLDLKSSGCADVNDIGEALAPLNNAQMVHLIAVALAAAARGDKDMASCPRNAPEPDRPS